jgi:prepilin-type processing-associated H-X9-DG protein
MRNQVITGIVILAATASIAIAQRRAPEPLPPGTSTIAGRVIDAETKQPVAGAEVTASVFSAGIGRGGTVKTGTDGWLRTGVTIDTWYGINLFNNVSSANSKLFPFKKIKKDSSNVIEGELTKLVRFRNSATLTIMFDGLRYFHGDRNRVNFRHNANRTANFLFADGHCESLNIGGLPDLDETKFKTVNNGVTNLKPWPHPLWRTDQF